MFFQIGYRSSGGLLETDFSSHSKIGCHYTQGNCVSIEVLPPSQNIATSRSVQSQTISSLTWNISKNNLFQIGKAIYYESWFRHESINNFVTLLNFMNFLLFMVKVKKI